MLEWLPVTPVDFVKPNGETISLKIFYELQASDSNLIVDSQGQDIDALAFKYLGTEAEALNILQNNAAAIVENNFDMSRVQKVTIPV